MRQGGEYVRVVTGYRGARLEYCRAGGNGKEGKRCLTDEYMHTALSYGGSETGRLEKLGSTWTCCPLCTIWIIIIMPIEQPVTMDTKR
jgi:hypothetical protein